MNFAVFVLARLRSSPQAALFIPKLIGGRKKSTGKSPPYGTMRTTCETGKPSREAKAVFPPQNPQAAQWLSALDSERPLTALRQMGAASESQLELLRSQSQWALRIEPLLRHPEAPVRLEAILLLGKLEAYYKAMDPAFAALNHQDRYADDHLELQALKELLCTDPRTPDFLLQALCNRIGYVRYQAACCLGLLDFPQWEVLQALEEALDDDNTQVRNAAHLALKRLQRLSVEPLPTPPQDSLPLRQHRIGFLELDEGAEQT